MLLLNNNKGMERFKTQFTMSGVPTDVMVQPVDNDTFDCTLMLIDYFEGEEFGSSEEGPDATVKLTDDTCQIVGESKITLTETDLKSLAEAITTVIR
jgi:hypothetical protein